LIAVDLIANSKASASELASFSAHSFARSLLILILVVLLVNWYYITGKVLVLAFPAVAVLAIELNSPVALLVILELGLVEAAELT
jgi:hypothetical protein